MSSADNIERAIAELNLTTRADTDKRILDDSYAALDKAVHKQQTMTDAGFWQKIIRIKYAAPAAIAAMILLAFSLFLNFRLEKSIGTEKIYGALNKVDNIHITTYRAGQTKPEQQVWASQSLGVKLFKTELDNQTQYTLWDTKNRIKMVRFLSSNAVQTEPITQLMLNQLEKSTAGPDDIVPFSDRNNIPAEAQWVRIDDREVAAAVSGAQA
ncbi:MAG: hypothetical protein ACYS3S_07150, partial [Planctomycetota bacterium]